MTNELIQRLKKREFVMLLALSAVVVLLFVLLMKAEISGSIPNYVSHIGHKGEEQFIYHLQDGQTIIQTFSSPRNFDFATINFSDHDTMITGKTFLSVTNAKTGELVEYLEINNQDIRYGQPVRFLSEGGKKDAIYRIALQFEGMGENGLGIYGYLSDEEGATIDDAVSEYAVGVGTHSYTNIFRLFSRIVVGGIIFLIFLTVIFVTQTKLKEEYLFLGIAIPIGILFLSFLSGNSVHDGSTHLAKTYHYSNVLLGWNDYDTSNYVYLKEDEAEVFNNAYEDYRRENSVAYELWEMVEDFGKKATNIDLVKSHEFRGTSASSFIEYFPGAFGITMGRIFGVSARMNLLIAKSMFLIFYVGIVFLAIRISPYLKTGIAFCALLPMAMYQAAGITYDSVVTATAFLLIALYFKIRNQKLIARETALYFATALVLGCCKGGFYLLLFVPFFFVSAAKYGGGRKKILICVGGVIVGVTAMFLTSFDAYWSMLTSIFHIRAESETVSAIVASATAKETFQEIVPETQTAAYGISYLFSNFPGFIKLLIRTIAEETEFYLGGLIGYRMAWTDETVSWSVLLLYCILLIGATGKMESEDPIKFSLWDRIICLGVIGLEIAAFHVLMLIETPNNSQTIVGVQGRYFLALTPILLMILYSNQRKNSRLEMGRLFYFYACTEGIYMYNFLKIFLSV